MSFPYHDPPWVGAAEFLRRHHQPGETILAPDAFIWQFDRIHRYANTRIDPAARYDWAVIHKWMLHHLDGGFLARLDAEMRPVHADGIFVIWTRRKAVPRLSRFDPNVKHFRRNRRSLATGDSGYVVGREFAGPPPVLPDEGTLFRFRSVPRAELKKVYDRFFENGGYRYETRRDLGYTQDIDRHTSALLGDTAGKRILDVACGEGRVAGLIRDCADYVGTDLAEVPLRKCRRAFAGRAGFRFAAMASEALALPPESFDIVTFIDAIEHVYDHEATLAEIARVMRPGGKLVVTGQNRDSLHLVVNRKLGYPEFLTNNQHLRELSFREMTAALTACGFAITQSAGILLYPYWQIPGIDEHIRRITDDDVEFAEIMRVLGERAGPEHAFTYILAAQKTA